MITLRAAHRGELETLSGIAWRAKASWGYPAAWMECWREILSITQELLRDTEITVICRESQPAGFCGLRFTRDDAELEHCWIEPAFQGQGLGRQLVAHARDRTLRHGFPGMDIIADPHAEAFYRRQGAETVGTLAAPMPGFAERTLSRLWLPSTPR